MTLSDWDREVSPHLQFIEAGAERAASGAAMAARRAKLLPVKPAFETKAQEELAKARGVLERALADIIAAQAIYAGKPVEMQAAE